MRVSLLWPSFLSSACSKNCPIYLVGWRFDDDSFCVIDAVVDKQLDVVQNRIEVLFKNFKAQFGWTAMPTVVGVVESSTNKEDHTHKIPEEKPNVPEIWINVVFIENILSVLSISKNGKVLKISQLQLILYDAPNIKLLEHYTFDRVILTLSDWIPLTSSASNILCLQSRDGKTCTVNENLIIHIHDSAFRSHNASSFSRCLPELNQSFLWQSTLRQCFTSAPILRHSVILHSKNVCCFIFYYILLAFVSITRPISFLGITLANLRFPSFFIDGLAINQLSITARQVELRCRQIRLLPEQLVFLNRLKTGKELREYPHSSVLQLRQAHFLHCMNHVSLLFVDLILGIVMGKYLILHARYVADSFVTMIDLYGVKTLRFAIHWLMGVPAGLKLNHELSTILGTCLFFLVNLWAVFLYMFWLILPLLVYFTATCSIIFGASFMLALFSDALAIASLHLSSFYIITSILYRTQVSLLSSMFLLFRGKKRNLLKERIEPHDYDIDQALVGILCFTLLVFLLPTTAVYYFLFASMRTVTLFLHGGIELLVATLHFFPLFSAALYAWNAKTLQNGIYLEERTVVNIRGANVSCFQIKNSPISLTEVYSNYFAVIGGVVAHYLSPSTLQYLLRGSSFRPLNLKFPDLPDSRYQLSELKCFLRQILLADNTNTLSN